MANVFSKALNRILCAGVRGKHSLPRCQAAGEEPALGDGSCSAQAPGTCEGSADISRAPRKGGAGVVVPFKGTLKPPARKYSGPDSWTAVPDPIGNPGRLESLCVRLPPLYHAASLNPPSCEPIPKWYQLAGVA